MPSISSELTPLTPFAYLVSCFVFQWRRNCGLRVTIPRSPSHHNRLCFDSWCLHPALDPPQLVQQPLCRRVLAAIWCPRSVGRHSDPAGRDESARLPRDIPRCHLPTRKREEVFNPPFVIRCWFYWLIAMCIDGFVRLCSDRGDGW